MEERRKREWPRPSADVPRIMPTELHGWQGIGSVGGSSCVSGSTTVEGRKIEEN